MLKVKSYLVELILIISATVITSVSIFLHLQNKNAPAPEVLASEDTSQITNSPTPSPENKVIFVDVSGAVINPDLYEATQGSRLKDVIELAGGLSEEADKLYISRNFNMSKPVEDEEKIYVPFTWDITNGTFVEEPRVLEYLNSTQKQSKISPTSSPKDELNIVISINTASVVELDTLPGVGPVTAQKIIDYRPYASLDELLSKKVINSSTFEKIKDVISL